MHVCTAACRLGFLKGHLCEKKVLHAFRILKYFLDFQIWANTMLYDEIHSFIVKIPGL